MSMCADLVGVIQDIEGKTMNKDSCAALLIDVFGALEWEVVDNLDLKNSDWMEIERAAAYEMLWPNPQQ